MKKRAFLMILDGWGLNEDASVNALKAAHTPYVDSLFERYPHSELVTYGEEVGLPEGQMGNSEVGHLNLGAGRVVYQELARINKAIKEGTIKDNDTFKALVQKAEQRDRPVHLMGLLSDGGVHAHVDHIIAMANHITTVGRQVYLHMFMDGRDTGPNSGISYLKKLKAGIDPDLATISTIIGRYYAMDRDQRWERISRAYDLLTQGKGELVSDPIAAVQSAYDSEITDEFMTAFKVGTADTGLISEGDCVLFANFRTDRPRQLTRALTQQAFPDFGMKPMDLYYVTMTRYDAAFKNINVIYEKENLTETLGEIIAAQGLRQLRIAETEKYPHVTFFFSGGREEPFKGEVRKMIASPKVATYDLQPEMSAYELTTTLINSIDADQPDLVIMNFANADMVGHTGNFQAAIKAAETLDSCLEVIIPKAMEAGYSMLVIADHGNSDLMKNPDGSPHTAHTTNPVPIILIQPDQDMKQEKKIKSGNLGDVAPTLLHLMGIKQPNSMTGRNLIETTTIN